MGHLKSILLKFIVFSVITSLVFVFYGFTITSLLLLSFLLAIVTYVLGDLLILPLKGNLIATIADGCLVFLGLLIWTGPSYGFYYSLLAGALFVAVFAALCEWFTHLYVIGNLNEKNREPTYE